MALWIQGVAKAPDAPDLEDIYGDGHARKIPTAPLMNPADARYENLLVSPGDPNVPPPVSARKVPTAPLINPADTRYENLLVSPGDPNVPPPASDGHSGRRCKRGGGGGMQ